MDYDNYAPNSRSGYNQRQPSSTNHQSQPNYLGSVNTIQTPRDTTPPKTTHKYPIRQQAEQDSRTNLHRPIVSIDNMDYTPHKVLGTYEREQDDVTQLSLDELNRELDGNINEIILLLNRRRGLVLNKKRRLQEEFYNKVNDLKRYAVEDYQNDLQRVAGEDQYIQQLTKNQNNLSRMSKVMNSMVRDQSAQDRKQYEMGKSQDFWSSNKNLENEIDAFMKRLKSYDQELEKQNSEIYEICRSLDQIDESIRDLLISKMDDHLQRAEPLFHQKQKQQSILNQKLQQRNKLKDEKMALIYKIIQDLQQLKQVREDRLRKLGVVFGDDELPQSTNTSYTAPVEQSRLQVYTDFIDQLENISKMRDIIANLESQEQGIVLEIEKIYKENDVIFNDLVRKQSEEAKIFNDWTDNLKKRLRYSKGTEYFFLITNLKDLSQYDFRDIMKKFRDNMSYLKPLVEEDSAIRQGLNKTNETIDTFRSIIRSIESEKERRRELLNILENCARLRTEEDSYLLFTHHKSKTDQLRNVELEITKKVQQKKNLEEDLDGVLGDADLNTFKKIENILHNYEQELQQLQQQRKKIVKELEDINQDVIQQLALIKSEFDDILKEILPVNWMNTYDLKKTSDLKLMKNYLKKTFKRFGIIPE